MLLSLLLALPLFSHAANVPSGFDLPRYRGVIERAAVQGEPMQVDYYEYRVLSRLEPGDREKPHQADYFSAVGGVDSQGKFHAIQVSMVSEDWRKRANGDWEIEQWIWQAGTDGELQSVLHFLLVETATGTVLDDVRLPSGPATDPGEQGRWYEKVRSWF